MRDTAVPSLGVSMVGVVRIAAVGALACGAVVRCFNRRPQSSVGCSHRVTTDRWDAFLSAPWIRRVDSAHVARI